MSPKTFLTRRSLRLSLRLITTYIRINWRLFVIGLFLGSLTILSLPKLKLLFIRPAATLVGMVGNYTISSLPLNVQNEISFGLTKLSPNGQASPGAALRWEATDSGKSITFDLQNDLFWQNGSKFDASQINYNLKGVTIKPKSLHAVTFELKDSFAPLPVIVSQPLFKNGLVGLGDNEVDGIRFNGRFISSIELKNIKTQERKIYKFYPTEPIAAQALQLGSVGQVISFHQTYNLEKDQHYQIATQEDESQVVTLFFNLRNEFLVEKSVRQALTYALPDSFPEGTLADSPIPPTNWAYNPNIKVYPHSLDPAKKAFAQNAWPSAKPKLVISAPTNLNRVAKEIAESWTDGGVPTTVVTADLLPSSFDVYLAYLDLPSDPDQYALWHSTQTGNITGYKSPKIDKLLEDGRKTLDPQARKEIYFNFQRAMTEDVPVVFLFYPKTYSITRR